MHRLSDLFAAVQEKFAHLGWLGVLGFAGATVLLQMVLIPLSPAGLAAGMGFGFFRGLIAITLGTNLGAAVNFLISRHLARNAVNRWLGHHEKFRLIDAAIGREGWKIIALLRLCPMPFGLANYAYGLTAVGFWPYMLATFVAIIPANCLFVWIGTGMHDLAAISDPNRTKSPAEIAVFVIGILAAFLVLRHITKIAKAAIAKTGEPAAGIPVPPLK